MAVVGIVLGWGLGALLTFIISKIPVNFRGILRTDYFLVDWSVYDYLIAAAAGRDRGLHRVVCARRAAPRVWNRWKPCAGPGSSYDCSGGRMTAGETRSISLVRRRSWTAATGK